MKRISATFGVTALLLALCVGSASAAPRSSASATSLCSVAKGVAKDIVNSTTFSKTVTPANLKTTYLKIKAAEPALLGASSGALKTDLRQVFGFVNVVIADFQKVNWQPSGIVQYLPSLAPKAQKVDRPLKTLKVYFATTCKLDV
jgi:hypothetical protein